jgi:cytosine/adenosine deaminase-related metal-dependent hydrolase
VVAVALAMVNGDAKRVDEKDEWYIRPSDFAFYIVERLHAAGYRVVPAPTLSALDAETLRRAINASHETERPIDLHAAENILEALRDAV